jgi:hypothetical protein
MVERYIRHHRDEKQFTFSMLEMTGSYIIKRLIHRNNGDGRITSGIYINRKIGATSNFSNPTRLS